MNRYVNRVHSRTDIIEPGEPLARARSRSLPPGSRIRAYRSGGRESPPPPTNITRVIFAGYAVEGRKIVSRQMQIATMSDRITSNAETHAIALSCG